MENQNNSVTDKKHENKFVLIIENSLKKEP